MGGRDREGLNTKQAGVRREEWSWVLFIRGLLADYMRRLLCVQLAVFTCIIMSDCCCASSKLGRRKDLDRISKGFS